MTRYKYLVRPLQDSLGVDKIHLYLHFAVSVIRQALAKTCEEARQDCD